MHDTSADWFEQLTGFRETTWEETRARLEVTAGRLRSRVNNRSFAIGELELPSLAELRARAERHADRVKGRLSLTNVCGDVGDMHRDPANRGAVIQVASQFNLLEMINEEVTPEDGVARYRSDPTQGPACAVAAGAATIYRNYFVPVGDHTGQTAARQLDCLADLGAAFDNTGSRLWTMRNGYALGTKDGLEEIDHKLANADSAQVDAWRDLLRIGIHWDVEVAGTAGDVNLPNPAQVVTQAFCSALPVAYSDVPAIHWHRFAALVLEGAYEATVWAAVVNAARGASNRLFLTSLGGGAFGNDRTWIDAAMRRALKGARGFDLDVRLVSYRAVPEEAKALAEEFR